MSIGWVQDTLDWGGPRHPQGSLRKEVLPLWPQLVKRLRNVFFRRFYRRDLSPDRGCGLWLDFAQSKSSANIL